jgi:hypothetical protein
MSTKDSPPFVAKNWVSLEVAGNPARDRIDR